LTIARRIARVIGTRGRARLPVDLRDAKALLEELSNGHARSRAGGFMKPTDSTRREFIKASALSLFALSKPWIVSAAQPRSSAEPVDPQALRALGRKLNGRVITPADEQYDSARRVWNFRFDRRPAAIVECAGAGDVARAVDFARQHKVLASIRSGGHSQAGWSVCDGGLVIDLSRMKKVAIDPARRVARAEPGITRVEFERATQKHGLVTAMGQCQDVGLGGLVLGGGEGALMGSYGAACDNVTAAQIVLADGPVLTASHDHNPGLLWGICGGAGNLGAVTELTFQLYPLREAVAGWLWYPFARTRDVMRAYRDFARSYPDEVFTSLNIARPDDREPMAGIYFFDSNPDRAEKDLAALRKIGSAARDTIKRRGYLDAQAAAGFPVVWGWSSYQRSGFAPEITDQLIEVISSSPPPRGADLWFAHLHGEISRRPIDFNAYHQRRPGFTFWAEADWKGAEPTAAIEWVNRLWKIAQPSTDGVYVNMLDVEPDRTREAYGANYARLAQLKAKYDPDNFFRMNVNVKPA
jgi:FAD/FMN-containing dehydrogenase